MQLESRITRFQTRSKLFDIHNFSKKEFREDEPDEKVYPETFLSLQLEKASIMFFFISFFFIAYYLIVKVIFKFINFSFVWFIFNTMVYTRVSQKFCNILVNARFLCIYHMTMEGNHCGRLYYGCWFADILYIASFHVWFKSCIDECAL